MHFKWNSEFKVCRCMCGTFHICMYILAIVSASGVVHFLLPIKICQMLCFPPKQASLLAGPKLWSVTGHKRNTMASCFNQVGDWIHYNFPSGVWNIKKDTILIPNSSCALVMIDRLTLRNGPSSASAWKLFSLSMLDYNWSNRKNQPKKFQSKVQFHNRSSQVHWILTYLVKDHPFLCDVFSPRHVLGNSWQTSLNLLLNY